MRRNSYSCVRMLRTFAPRLMDSADVCIPFVRLAGGSGLCAYVPMAWPAVAQAGLVNRLDQAGLYEVEGQRKPAFVMYSPANCEPCDQLDARQFWPQVAVMFKSRVTVWSAKCTEPAHYAVCKDRGLPFEEGGPQQGPVFEVWNGTLWRRYIGQRKLEELISHLQEGAYQTDGGVFVSQREISKHDGMAYAFAKHAARSPQTDWASLGSAWPMWTPCNVAASYEQACAPKAPACESTWQEGDRGLGNNLYFYAEAAAEAFARNCTIRFFDGATPAKARFTLGTHFVNPTPSIPTTKLTKPALQPGPCSLHAITRLRDDSLAASKLAALWEGTPTAPVVGMHLRTGWADALRHDEWRALRCSALASQPGYDAEAATTYIVAHAPEFARGARANLSTILDNVVSAADAAFGSGTWKLFVASDSTAVSRLVAARLEQQVLAVRSVAGRVGHNHAPENEADSELLEDVGASSVADFMALRDSDMLLGFNSNFQKRAGQASVCPQRWYEMRSRTKEDEVIEHVLEMDRLLRGGKGLGARLAEQRPARPLEEHVPPDHPCLRSATPLHDCACFYRLALDGSLPWTSAPLPSISMPPMTPLEKVEL